MHDRNLAFIDTETTGLDFDKHEVIEIGCVIVKQSGIETGKPTFIVVDEFEMKIKPERIEDADPVALRVNGYDPASWLFAYDLKQAMTLFAEKTKDAIMVSHNTPFDYGFLDKAFRKTGVINTMHYHKLDTISIAFAKLYMTGDVTRFSLRFLCDYFGIDNKNAHTALSDARALFELYQKLMTIK
jgi:DNA polymerase-3 subunit epsilon